MAGIDQVVVLRTQLYQQQPQQRRLGQIKTTLAFGVGQRVEGLWHTRARLPVLHLEGQGQGLANHLERALQLTLPNKAAAQNVMGIDACLPGATEALDIQPFHVQTHLVDVVTALFIQGMKEHALLHRRQRVDIFDLLQFHRQLLKLGLVEPGQGEVRRRRRALFQFTAVLDQCLQFGDIVVGQALHRGFVEHLPAEAPAQAELAGIHPAVQAQPVAQVGLRALVRAHRFGGRHEQRPLLGIEAGIELAQVVEGDPWHRQRRQALAAGAVTQVAQGAPAQALVRDRAQLFLDLLDAAAQCVAGADAQWEQAGEPAHGAGQVEAVKQLFTAMAFELDQGIGLPAPAPDHPRQGAEQQVVDLGAVGRRGFLQQAPGQLRRQAAVHRASMPVGQAGVRAGARQRRLHPGQLRLPIATLGLDFSVQGIGLQALGPVTHAVGAGRQLHHLALAQLLVGLLQVFENDPPRHAVHRQVMDHQQQALLAIAQGRQHRTQQRAIVQVKAALGLLAEVFQRLGIGDLALPQHAVARQAMVSRLPLVVIFDKAQAQRVMLLQQRLQGLLQHRAVQQLVRFEQHRLVPVMALDLHFVEEHPVDRQQRARPFDPVLVNRKAAGPKACHRRQALYGLVLEQRLGGEMNARLPRPADHLDRDDRVAAQFEEVVAQADPFQLEHVLPDGGNALFQVAVRGHVGGLQLAQVRHRQGLAVELAVGGQWQLFKLQQVHRHHVVRQVLAQAGLELLGIERLAGHHVAHQLLAAGAVDRQHHRFAHRRLLVQARFDLAQLDTKTTDLDLVVDTADVLQHAVGAVAGQVAAAVHALARRPVRVGHELLGGQPRAQQVAASQAVAGQVQLGGHALRHRLQLGVEQVAGGVEQWPADVGLATGLAAAEGRIGGVFRRPVQVVDLLHRGLGVQCFDQRLLERLAGQIDDFNARRDFAGTLQGGNRRRHGVDQAYLLAGRQLWQFQGVAGHDQETAIGQGDEDFPDRQVEAHRGRGQHALDVFSAVHLLRPVRQGRDVAVGDGHALGLAGGAGGVDHIGEVLRRGTRCRRTVRVAGIVFDQHGDNVIRPGLKHPGLGQQHPRLAVFEHVAEPFARVVRVQWHIGATGLEHRQQGHHQLGAARHGHTDPHLGANAQFDQAVGQAVGAALQPGMGKGLFAIDQGQGLRCGLGTLRDQLVDAAIGIEGFTRRVQGKQLFTLVNGEQWQLTQGLCRCLDNGLQQAQPMVCHTLDSTGFEQVGGIGERSRQAIGTLVRAQGQVELGILARPTEAGDLQVERDTATLRTCSLLGLVVIHHLEQRAIAEAALRLQGIDQLFERQVLMFLGLQGDLTHLLEQCVEALLTIKVGLQHLGVDEKADQALGFQAVTVGDRHPDANARLPAVTEQQCLVGGKQQHEQGHPLLLGQLAQRSMQLTTDRQLQSRTAQALLYRPDMIGGQLQDHTLTPELLLPVVELPLTLTRIHPLALPGGVVGVLDWQRRQLRHLALAQRGVALQQLVDHHLHRPAIRHDMVLSHHQHVALWADAKQVGAQQQVVLQVKGLAHRLAYETVAERCCIAVLRQGMAPHLEIHLVTDQLHALAIALGKSGTQAFMPFEQGHERLLKRLAIELAIELQDHGNHIRGTVRIELPEKPLTLLGIGQRHARPAIDGLHRQLIAARRLAQCGNEGLQTAVLEHRAQRHLHRQCLTHP